MQWERIEYHELKGKHREAYNYAKVASVLAEYGFECARFVNDLNGADFAANNPTQGITLAVQQKSGLEVRPAYLSKNLWIVFQVSRVWYLIKHDELWKIVDTHTNKITNMKKNNDTRAGWSGDQRPNKEVMAAIEPYRMSATPYVPFAV